MMSKSGWLYGVLGSIISIAVGGVAVKIFSDFYTRDAAPSTQAINGDNNIQIRGSNNNINSIHEQNEDTILSASSDQIYNDLAASKNSIERNEKITNFYVNRDVQWTITVIDIKQPPAWECSSGGLVENTFDSNIQVIAEGNVHVCFPGTLRDRLRSLAKGQRIKVMGKITSISDLLESYGFTINVMGKTFEKIY